MNEKIIVLEKITKSFFGNNALTDVDFDLNKSEIHCICGENGAGKSTLIKLLSGALLPDNGKIIIDGAVYKGLSPQQAHVLGIQVIYQESHLFPNMNIAENIFAGHEKLKRFCIIDKRTLHLEAQKILDDLGTDLNSYSIVDDLSVAQKQYVKIARALAHHPKVLIFDEPTTMFNITDANRLLNTIVELKQKGISIIYITHKLSEIIQIADRVTVLRDGYKISCHDSSLKRLTISQITNDMIGRSMELLYKREKSQIGKTVFEVKDLKVKPGGPQVSFSLRRGEILGIAGMVGAGRTEIAEAIFGVAKKYGGTFWLHGEEIRNNTPQHAIANGLCLITEDRQKTGVLLDMNINQNITITALDKIKGFLMDKNHENDLATEIVKKTNLKALDYNTDVRYLSGGNQQKVVVGKWIFRDAEIIIFDEPTRGIDINSKSEIYALMEDLLKDGKSIIMISSDMPELISISDRVLIVKGGKIVGQLEGDDINEEGIIALAL